ncbi:hypothetical protein L6452_33292 [Arctium lappa]|uniref:Uncharacterized protein n=1 Tax=Arctium lappa TaxID=4217 RepID=A0ACB8Z623_ARCLA|nr:hypothetical protein L6452_33292 [Arctium lappa]
MINLLRLGQVPLQVFQNPDKQAWDNNCLSNSTFKARTIIIIIIIILFKHPSIHAPPPSILNPNYTQIKIQFPPNPNHFIGGSRSLPSGNLVHSISTVISTFVSPFSTD